MLEGKISLRLLGRCEAWKTGRKLTLGPPKQRAVLSVLALQLGDTVGNDHLIDAVWGENPPSTAMNSIHTYIRGLRNAFEEDRSPRSSQTLLSSTGGYTLSTEIIEVDSLLFESWVTEAHCMYRKGEHDQALASLDEGLAIWKGNALDGIPGPFAEIQRARLNELKISAVEHRLGLLLDLGRHDEAIPELSALVRQFPLHERLVELLILALYRSGRRAESLETFSNFRKVSVTELGLEPGVALRRCHEQVLAGDPALDYNFDSALQ